MNNLTIPYFSTNYELPNYLQKHLKSEGFSLEKYQIGTTVQAPIFLLFSPVWHHQHFISCDSLWKNYFQKKHPNTKLISVGIKGVSHSNYIDLLRLPNDFHAFFEQALTAQEKWTPTDTEGLNMDKRLKRFLQGHGSDSVSEILSPIKNGMTIIQDELMNNGDFSEIWHNYIIPVGLHYKWFVLTNRFSNYYPFFDCLPFFKNFKKVHGLIQDLQPFFQHQKADETLFKQLDCVTKINKIKFLIDEVKKYVSPKP